jgi:signal transduction histidine kinase
LETIFDESLPLVNCLPGELNQVFLNIIINASHAIKDMIENNGGEKGKITVQTINREKFVEIRINDTGNGIPENIRNKIFDPFFTTKEVGKGTGQGLSIVHDIIIKKHDGNIWFESKMGIGTTFILELPIET